MPGFLFTAPNNTLDLILMAFGWLWFAAAGGAFAVVLGAVGALVLRIVDQFGGALLEPSDDL